MTLKIYGYSDDCVEVEGHFREEYTLGRNDKTTLRLANDDGVAFAVVRYTKLGTWSVEIRQADEDVPLPWPVEIRQSEQVAYSLEAVIECPDDVKVEVV